MITAVLPWYDEPVDELVACVGALGGTADRIVALDGAYRRYPGGRPSSPPEQAIAIRETAAAHGLDCLVLAPDRLWAGQVEKRSCLLAIGVLDTDWVMTIDSDHVVAGDGAVARAFLADTVADVVEAPYHYPLHPSLSPREASATYWAEGLAGKWEQTPHFYRALPGLRVEKRHWNYSALKGAKRVWMWADEGDRTYPHASHAKIEAGYHVEHRCLLRTPEKLRANRAFCNDRVMVVERTGQEDHVDGLPEPQWEYEERLV